MNSPKTTCVHAGTIFDEKTRGVNSPIYTSSSFEYLDLDEAVYPRYFNIPNTEALGEKIAALEQADAGMVFSSGMAAITSVLFAFLRQGDHAIFQTGLYGGTFHFVTTELERFGIAYDISVDNEPATFEGLIKENTRLIYIETPSNPLLKVTDIKATVDLARSKNLITVIDNTFASPINQNPHNLGVDVVIHSATKYLGGHADICAGAAASLNAQTVYLLERSMKTLALRIEQQNRNAGFLAEKLSAHSSIEQVYYPGLANHPEHEIARQQMSGFGGMLSFEIRDIDPVEFQRMLKLIKPSVSLGGVDTIICSPALTSHRHLSPQEKKNEGMKKRMRGSVTTC